MEYRNVGSHVEDLFGGATVGVGETVELNDEQAGHPHNERLLSEGTFIPIEGKNKTQNRRSAKAADEEGGSKE